MSKFSEGVAAALREVAQLLAEKNQAYGDSVSRPVRIFSKATDPIESIDVRIDDKLARIRESEGADQEDTELDLIGYLVMRRYLRTAKGERHPLELVTPDPDDEYLISEH